MKWELVVQIIGGGILLSLGILWFLQGSDLVHIKPILCFADCEPITGKSLQWQIVGAITALAGIWLIYTSTKRI